MLLLSTYLICLLLLIDQGLFNLLIISQSIHSQQGRRDAGTQLRYVGFQTIGSFPDQMAYNKYIQRKES